ncbi:MAG: hypothetical protein AAFW98_02960 [Pseudomonadota bacterium]
MTIQTMFDQAPAVSTQRKTLAEKLEGTALDLEKGRAREYRVTFALMTMVLVVFFAIARLVTFAQATGPRRSIVHDAKSAASSALGYAYRH